MAIRSLAILNPMLVFSPMFLPCATVCARRRWVVACWISLVFGAFALDCRSKLGCAVAGVLGKSLAGDEDDSIAPNQLARKHGQHKASLFLNDCYSPSFSPSPHTRARRGKKKGDFWQPKKPFSFARIPRRRFRWKRDVGVAQDGIAVRACDTT